MKNVKAPVAVEEIALECGSAGFLVVTVALRLVLVIPEKKPSLKTIKHLLVEIVPVAIVPGATMGLPRSKAHPAEISLNMNIHFTTFPKKSIVQQTILPLARLESIQRRSHLAALVFADHVVATPILLDGSSTLGTLLGVCRDPVARLAVVVALLDPLLDEVAPDGVVPVLAASEAEGVTTGALHWPRLHMLHLYCVAAVRTRAPTEQPLI